MKARNPRNTVAATNQVFDLYNKHEPAGVSAPGDPPRIISVEVVLAVEFPTPPLVPIFKGESACICSCKFSLAGLCFFFSCFVVVVTFVVPVRIVVALLTESTATRVVTMGAMERLARETRMATTH